MPKGRGEISVTYMSGPLDGKTLTFPQPNVGQEKTLTIGRRDDCDVNMAFDNQVSRVHAYLGCSAQPTTDPDLTSQPATLSFWLEDGGSRNGTFIEKAPNPLTSRVSLRPGTLFRIGRTWLRLDIPLSFGL